MHDVEASHWSARIAHSKSLKTILSCIYGPVGQFCKINSVQRRTNKDRQQGLHASLGPENICWQLNVGYKANAEMSLPRHSRNMAQKTRFRCSKCLHVVPFIIWAWRIEYPKNCPNLIPKGNFQHKNPPSLNTKKWSYSLEAEPIITRFHRHRQNYEPELPASSEITFSET